MPTRRPSKEERIIAAAMALAGEQPWGRVTMADIAAGAKVSLADVQALFPTKSAVIAAFIDGIDQAVLAGTDKDAAAEPPHDRLLDTLMRRIDLLTPHKAAIVSIARAGMADPLSALCGAPRFLRSMRWMLDCAGIPTAGPAGRIRVKGLAAIWLSTVRVWLRDDSEDASATLAHLDAALRRAERLASLLPGGPVRSASAA